MYATIDLLSGFWSKNSLINKSSMPYGVNPIKTVKTKTTTTQGTYTSDEVVFLNYIVLPEFVNGLHVQGVSARLFDSPTCPYDVILGRDFLQAIGLKQIEFLKRLCSMVGHYSQNEKYKIL